MKKIEIETPKFENMQVGTTSVIKWKTSDGQQWNDETSAEHYEFFFIKLKKRGVRLPTENLEIVNLTSEEDFNRYFDFCYDEDYIKQFNKNELQYPNAFAIWEEYRYDSDDDETYGQSYTTNLHCVTLDDYKKLLIDAANNIQ